MHATLRRLAVATAFWGAGAGAAMAQPSLHLVAPGGGAGMTVAAVGGNAVVGGDGVAHVFDGVTGALLLTLRSSPTTLVRRSRQWGRTSSSAIGGRTPSS
jgi:hypothetical protein